MKEELERLAFYRGAMHALGSGELEKEAVLGIGHMYRSWIANRAANRATRGIASTLTGVGTPKKLGGNKVVGMAERYLGPEVASQIPASQRNMAKHFGNKGYLPNQAGYLSSAHITETVGANAAKKAREAAGAEFKRHANPVNWFKKGTKKGVPVPPSTKKAPEAVVRDPQAMESVKAWMKANPWAAAGIAGGAGLGAGMVGGAALS